eukprot:TRINITY_DN3017_c0_g1_i2.p4 TRINITY_DN3017_c0_g1~~TRINITY_DN3017_c0_g1_i2.p4  ORF type:complete len:100 (-),score=12.58 TRINITY_DN3017_c0_g1_i2:185-484(-)
MPPPPPTVRGEGGGEGEGAAACPPDSVAHRAAVGECVAEAVLRHRRPSMAGMGRQRALFTTYPPGAGGSWPRLWEGLHTPALHRAKVVYLDSLTNVSLP